MELANSNGIRTRKETSRTFAECLKDYIKVKEEERRRSDWYIDEEGYLCHKGEYYEIDPDRLAENWIGHMARKRWVNMNTFIPAYIEACERAGVQQVNITY